MLGKGVKRSQLDCSSSSSSSETDDLAESSDKKRPCLEGKKLKNSTQLLNELTGIKSIKYELSEVKGPAHDRMFTVSLRFELDKQLMRFSVSANSARTARKLVSLKALNHVTNLSSYTEINSKLDDYYKRCVYHELDSLLNMNISVGSDSTLKNLPDDEELDHVRNELDSDTVFDLTNYDLLEFKLIVEQFPYLNSDKLLKTLSTNNPLSILSHIASGTFEFADKKIDSNLRHTELKINKQRFYAKFLTDNNNNNQVNVPSSTKGFEETENEFVFAGSGTNFRNARIDAAWLSLKHIFNIQPLNDRPKLLRSVTVEKNDYHYSSSQKKTFADVLLEISLNKYNELINLMRARTEMNEKSRLNELNSDRPLNMHAAVFQSNGFDVDSLKLIGFATGCKCINGECLSQHDKSLNDCHAEILAIRLLKKYLCKSLIEYVQFLLDNPYTTEQPANMIFEKSNVSTEKPFKIRQNVNFHLFISSAPCGDSRIVSLIENGIEKSFQLDASRRKIPGQLRVKLESGIETRPVADEGNIQTWDSIMLGEPLKIMSCSDKLCKFNVLGVQGSLMSNLIESVYLASIVVGNHFNVDNMERAMFKRLTKNGPELPDGFKLNKPILNTVTTIPIKQSLEAFNISLLWSDQLSNQFEIINCQYGKKLDDRESEICKSELFKDWIECMIKCAHLKDLEQYVQVSCLKMNNSPQHDQAVHLVEEFIPKISYQHAKQLSNNYQQAKHLLYDWFENAGLGKWLSVPFEQNHIDISY